MGNRQHDNLSVFSEQQLYLMGLQPTLPTFYILNTPVFKTDHTMGSASVTTCSHQSRVATYGARNRDFRQVRWTRWCR